MIKAGPSINLCVVAVVIIVITLRGDGGGRFFITNVCMRGDTRVFDTRGVVVDKMDRATYLSRHLFQTTQRNQRRLSGSPSTASLPSPLPLF